MMENTEPMLISVAEAARILGVSRPTVYQLLEREDFSCGVRIGSRRLISLEALRKWIGNQTSRESD